MKATVFRRLPPSTRCVRIAWRIAALAALAMTPTTDAVAADDAETRRPNVVVFLTDDQGWGDLSIHGNPAIETPRIDSLARDGVELTQFYVCPVCSPTRAEFLTGRYHPRSGVQGVTRGGERMNADEQTIADVFKRNGYATAAYGKWHNGMQWPYHPNARGFDDYYGFCSGHWGNYFSPMLEHNGDITKGEGYLVDDLTDHAIAFIREHRDDPFFVYVPYNVPHAPMQVPDRYHAMIDPAKIIDDPHPQSKKVGKNQPDPRQYAHAALAMCKSVDINVGRVLDTLESLDLDNDTIVVYFSDNGPNSYRFNGGMRGRKGSTYEGGVRSPCFIRFPGQIPGGRECQAVSGAVDLLPTLKRLTGIDDAAPKPLDGLDLTDHLTGETDADEPVASRTLVTHWSNRISVRDNQFRYHESGELYDIAADPDESENVANQYVDDAKRLSGVIRAYRTSTDPKRANAPDDRPFVVGHPDATYTQLPARDGNGSENIKRSSRHANCTFFQNWRTTDDEIFWDGQIAADGRFEVSMFYAVDKKDIGSKIRLTVGETSIDAVIDQPNETPLEGRENDRTLRTEGYVKDWKSMPLGTIALKEGPARISLRAIEVPGDEVAQMRLLLFRRIDSSNEEAN